MARVIPRSLRPDPAEPPSAATPRAAIAIPI